MIDLIGYLIAAAMLFAFAAGVAHLQASAEQWAQNHPRERRDA